MRIIFQALVLMPLLIITGCAGPGKIMNTWIGKTKEELVKTLGPATRIIDNGAAGKVMVYSEDVGVPPAPIEIKTSGEGDTYRFGPPAPPYKPALKIKMFYINPAGTIYAWKVENV